MLSREEFIRLSLEKNLFWLRIMKDHAIFIESAMPAPERRLAQDADRFKQQFEELLSATIRLANASISKASLVSGEFYTRFTDEAERLAIQFTDIDISRNLILQTTNIEPITPYSGFSEAKEAEVSLLNQSILSLMNLFIQFKTGLFNNQVSCWLFTFQYTAVLDHILREAREYVEILTSIQNKEEPYQTVTPEDEIFWNTLMADHAKAMRGLLDPTETMLFDEADQFARLFTAMVESEQGPSVTLPPTNGISMAETVALSELKAFITRGLIECKVRAIMMPLYTDHLLREANYYIRMLRA